jgi:hypothetical protein
LAGIGGLITNIMPPMPVQSSAQKHDQDDEWDRNSDEPEQDGHVFSP